jgi:hypothetical protein
MAITLTPHEARVIGCLMEKEVTTPENYPLSINALTNACNQKSNRDPLLDLAEAEVQAVVDGLLKNHLVSNRAGYGGRVAKYKQVFCNTEFGPLQFTDLERAIVCELLLRGAQSAGELRTRCQRMADVSDVAAVETALQNLTAHSAGPFVTRLGRAPGQRDVRYAHLLGTEPPEVPAPETAVAHPDRQPGLIERIERLEAEVARLKEAMAAAPGSGQPK